MPNPLTGDYEAVIQLSGRTVNRLLASMHQNVGSGKKLPTLPHQTVLRIGDAELYGMVGGVRGTARVQIGVPSIELIHGVTDRFRMASWIRAHFLADPTTAAFPEYIWGIVRAEYTLSVIRDPRRGTLLRLDVAPDDVSFTSAGADTSADARITEQVRLVLRTRLLPSAHPLLADFQNRRFRSLAVPGESAVAHPLDLSGAGTAGDITRVDQIFLGGKDFAVAVSREYILALVQPALDALKASKPTFSFSVKVCAWPFGWPCKTYTVTYQVSIHTATVQWSSGGVLTLRVAGGAETGSIFPNASFSVEQSLVLTFNPATETLGVVSGGPPAVSVDVNGPFGGLVEGYARNTVTSMFNAQLNAALTQIQPKLQGALGQKQKLITQLKSIDDQADARFDAVEYRPDGIVLRGTVRLAQRRMLSAMADKLADQSGYTALESWIPGGRIERFVWHWYWQTTPIGNPPDGSQTHDDRFLLLPTTPIPGVPVPSATGGQAKVPAGRLCLTIRGFQLNPQTGLEEVVDNVQWAERTCVYVVPTPPPPPFVDPRVPSSKRWWTLWLAAKASESATERVAAYVEADGVPTQPFNTLVYFPDAEADASLAVLEAGLREAPLDDAGLLLILVLRDGLLERGGAELGSALGALSERIEIPVMIAEDVQAGWSRGFSPPVGREGSATRLLAADGRGTWAHDGPPNADMLAAALREHLLPSPSPRAEPVRLALRPGDELPDVVLETGPGDWIGLDQLAGRALSLTFVQPWARPSIAQLRRLQRTHQRLERQGLTTLALVDGVDARAAAALAEEHGLTFLVGADPHGLAARRLGVRAWPTTVLIDADGRLAGVTMGADPGALEALAREQTETAAPVGPTGERRAGGRQQPEDL